MFPKAMGNPSLPPTLSFPPCFALDIETKTLYMLSTCYTTNSTPSASYFKVPSKEVEMLSTPFYHCIVYIGVGASRGTL